MPERASTTCSPGILLSDSRPCTWPLASVTVEVRLTRASAPGTVTNWTVTAAPGTGLPKAMRVTAKGTTVPGPAWSRAGLRVSWMWLGGLRSGWNATGPRVTVGRPLGAGAIGTAPADADADGAAPGSTTKATAAAVPMPGTRRLIDAG